MLILHLPSTEIIFPWNVSIISEKQHLVYAVFKNYGCIYSRWVISMLYNSFMSQLISGLLRNTVLCICGCATHRKHSDELPHCHTDTFGSQALSGQYTDGHGHECGCYTLETTNITTTASSVYYYSSPPLSLSLSLGGGVWRVHKS
jgi:hypothetical protein